MIGSGKADINSKYWELTTGDLTLTLRDLRRSFSRWVMSLSNRKELRAAFTAARKGNRLLKSTTIYCVIQLLYTV